MTDPKLLSDLNMVVSALYSGNAALTVSAETARIVDLIRAGNFDALKEMDSEILSSALVGSNRAIGAINKLREENKMLRQTMKTREQEALRKAREGLRGDIDRAEARAKAAEEKARKLNLALKAILEG